MKWILRIVLVLVILVVLVGVGVYFYADSAAKTAVERGGTYATGVDTTVDSVQLGLFSGEAGLSNLEIANPPGFERDYFLRLREADLAVGLGSLMSDVVQVPRVHLTGIELNLERTGEKPNYQVILENLERLSSTEPDPDAQQWVIDDLQIRDIHVIATVKGLAAETQTVEVTLPEIVLADVRSEGMAELQGQVIKQILDAVILQAGQQLPGVMLTELTAGVGQIGDLGRATLSKVSEATAIVGDLGERAGQVTGEVTERIEDLGRGATDAVEGVREGIGGLLRGRNNKEQEQAQDPE